jgi:hypothetical protein
MGMHIYNCWMHELYKYRLVVKHRGSDRFRRGLEYLSHWYYLSIYRDGCYMCIYIMDIHTLYMWTYIHLQHSPLDVHLYMVRYWTRFIVASLKPCQVTKTQWDKNNPGRRKKSATRICPTEHTSRCSPWWLHVFS